MKSVSAPGTPAREGRGGFTLMELMVVFGIIAVLTGIVFGVAGVAQRRALAGRATADLHLLNDAVEKYQANAGTYPVVEPAGVATSVTYVVVSNALAPYVSGKCSFVDPWGTPYFYVYRSRAAYDTFSAGPDRKHAVGVEQARTQTDVDVDNVQ